MGVGIREHTGRPDVRTVRFSRAVGGPSPSRSSDPLPVSAVAKRPLSEQSVEELRAALRGTLAIRLTVAIIFTILVAAWVIGGYVTKNPALFIVTVVMGVAATAIQHASVSTVRKELARRQ